jgi:hypothetical protein
MKNVERFLFIYLFGHAVLGTSCSQRGKKESEEEQEEQQKERDQRTKKSNWYEFGNTKI